LANRIDMPFCPLRFSFVCERALLLHGALVPHGWIQGTQAAAAAAAAASDGNVGNAQ
jgi:hypothetical protein